MKDSYVEDELDLLSTDPSDSRELMIKITTVRAFSRKNPWLISLRSIDMRLRRSC